MKICSITTGDIKNIATAKRALGLANPLVDLGWDVSILMEDTEENRHRVSMMSGRIWGGAMTCLWMNQCV